MRSYLVVSVAIAGCYSGGRATRDVNAAWHGRGGVELQARWGQATAAALPDGGTMLTWSRTSSSYTLPSVSLAGDGDIAVGPDGATGAIDAHLDARPGGIYKTRTDVIATVDAGGRVVGITGPSLWLGKGPPPGANLRWGTVFGVHAGIGGLDDATGPMPSLGLYIGGMLGPRLGLVGSYAFVNGSGDDGYGMAHSWSVGAQYWPASRIWLRAGPAMVVALDAGLENARVRPGLATGASYALVRGRVFVLDLRVDAIAATDKMFGTLGIGVNVN